MFLRDIVTFARDTKVAARWDYGRLRGYALLFYEDLAQFPPEGVGVIGRAGFDVGRFENGEKITAPRDCAISFFTGDWFWKIERHLRDD